MRRSGSIRFLLLCVFWGVFFMGCAQEEYPAALWSAQHPTTASALADAGAATPIGPLACSQARAQSLPARLVAMSSSSSSSNTSVVLVSDLFQSFNSVCNPCHTSAADPPGQGGFQIALAGEFASKMTPAVLQHVLGAVCPNPPNPGSALDPMPPCSSPSGDTFANRSQGDAIRQFADLVQEWIQAGSPTTSFTPPNSAPSASSAGDAGSSNQFAMSPQNGNAMTDLGNCIPSPALMATNSSTMTALDAKFAALAAQSSGTPVEIIGLPEHLAETDLFTFDSAALAQEGVIAYAPGYPLWSNNAGKLRYVRVPSGQSIHFDKATQQFEIPANTRFYKTFMKQIVDTDGSYRYRKIETRLIVSRPDQNNADGTAAKQTALYGTYQWNADESDAILIQTPLNDGKPFADTLFLYDNDEPLAADLLLGQPKSPETELLLNNAATHYAIPSSQRCLQCHMGSPSQSFILGFTPLQINRRPVGTGGIIEETGPDELTQLQRLIDAGIITGITSPSDVLPLEQSQGSRLPRNNYELTAQGYMLGNCAHCHNPRGYPTVQNPVLKDVLDFLPNADDAGVFQFPLERYSPRVGRGLTGSTPIPYITPSLADLPRNDPESGGQAADPFVTANPSFVFHVIYAPWRSLIFRNVESAFAYTDDLALYPHMPMNTPGYDPRVKQILGDWMVSIPSVRKQSEIVEYAYQIDGNPADNVNSNVVDSSPQPYVEVLPGTPAYNKAVTAAQQRLGIFHTGSNPAVSLTSAANGGLTYSRYADRGQTADILDPAVIQDPVCHPVPVGDPIANIYPFAEHPHWVITDLTLPPPPWSPRQPNWPTVLVEQEPPTENTGCTTSASAASAYSDQLIAVSLLPDALLDDVRTFATTPQPFGLWQTQAGCDFSSVPTVQSFTGAARPHWMDVGEPAPDAPVYMQTPGATIFKMICINCHGPNADSNGRLAQNLATMTGGNALVADFRDGLFGPVGASEAASNRHSVFGLAEITALPGFDQLSADAQAKWMTPATDDDRAARYMAWMGLGGTSINIPVAILEIVAVTKVLDQVRTIPASQLSANMLSQAKALCAGLLGPGYANSVAGAYFDPREGHGYLDAKLTNLNTTLIPSNGDAQLWLNLCSLANPPPVHVLAPDPRTAGRLDVGTIQDSSYNLDIDGNGGLVAAANYPAGTPVGNDRGGVDEGGLCSDPTQCATPNLWPWCVDETGATAMQQAWISAGNLPLCPASVIAASKPCGGQAAGAACFGNDDANRWAVRGAINAGFSVFTYVESIENTGPQPDYNQCNLLQ